MNKQLKVYNIVLNEEQGYEVDFVSIVENPAIESEFLKFSESTRLTFSGDEQKELLGVALIPDLPIYREVNGREFYVTFSKDTIRTIAQNFFKKNYSNNMNVEHTSEDAKSYIFQSYLVNRDMGLYPPKSLEEAPDGSWIIGVKVENDELWEDIKSGKRKGFSVEGLFGLESAFSAVKVSSLREDLEESDKMFDELLKVLY